MRALLIAAVLLEQAPIPVEQEPRHKVVYADARLRILDVTIPFGETTLDHAHRYDLATVCVECADTQSREPGGDWGPVRRRERGSWQVTEYRGHPGAHAVRTIAPGSYHLIAVENLGDGGFAVKGLPRRGRRSVTAACPSGANCRCDDAGGALAPGRTADHPRGGAGRRSATRDRDRSPLAHRDHTGAGRRPVIIESPSEHA